ncbi:ankyrin [Suhomyces tanzawaensis NRRL Y-17324]|uniref:Ankyrin n=1 Tax=Suhomyces tanzawaensis NRRL Y-17324 TaxID=984487 RepID=A0A1E4SBN5_9ASCO|nr:ankyrin [Suhomyces tanzawaensis NRRL Y-17324]ODV76876.1 ankyrin [Suhomyces tanzawaensis NRRL Y-17324]
MSYRGSGYYPRYGGSGGPPKKFGGPGGSVGPNNAPNGGASSDSHSDSSNSQPSQTSSSDKGRGMSGYNRRADRDYYGGYRSGLGRYESKYNKYGSGGPSNGPPPGLGGKSLSRSSSTYYGSAAPPNATSGSSYKRRPTDRYDSYPGTKYYSSSVSSNGVEESNVKSSYSKSYSLRSPEWKSTDRLDRRSDDKYDSFKPSTNTKPSTPSTISDSKSSTASSNKFLDERRGKSSASYQATFPPLSRSPSEIRRSLKSKNSEDSGSETPAHDYNSKITTNDNHASTYIPKQASDAKMLNFFDDDEPHDRDSGRTSGHHTPDFKQEKRSPLRDDRGERRGNSFSDSLDITRPHEVPKSGETLKTKDSSYTKENKTDSYKPKVDSYKPKDSKVDSYKPKEARDELSKPKESKVDSYKPKEYKDEIRAKENRVDSYKPKESHEAKTTLKSKDTTDSPIPKEANLVTFKPKDTKEEALRKKSYVGEIKADHSNPKEPKAGTPLSNEGAQDKPKEKTSFSAYLKSSKEKKFYVHSAKADSEKQIDSDTVRVGETDQVEDTKPNEDQPKKEQIKEVEPAHEQSREETKPVESIDKVVPEPNIESDTDLNGPQQKTNSVPETLPQSKDPIDEEVQKEVEDKSIQLQDSESQNETTLDRKSSTAGSVDTKVSRDETTRSEDTSMLSPIRSSVTDENFNFNNLGTIQESLDTKDLLSDVEESDDNEADASEAETVVADSPPALNRARRLIRKKDFDERRHKLKRKSAYHSEDEEREDHSDHNKNNTGDDLSGDEKKRMCIRPYKMKRDSGGRSLLQRACKKGNLEDIKNYLQQGANANEKDFCGFTCLHEAALEGHTEVVEILIEHGANVNAKADPAGYNETPLIDAAENKHLGTVKVLLENGADPSIFNIDGFTALTKIFNEHADEEGYEEIIKLLEEAIAKQQREKSDAVKSASPAPPVVEDPYDTYFGDLIKKKGICKFAAEGSKEVTANYFVSGNGLSSKPDILIIAARNGHVELVDIILGLNPTPYNIDTENECGATALLASVGRGHIEVVESLLSKDADPRKKRKQDNLNALEIAQRSTHFDPKEVKLLQEYMGKTRKSGVSSTISSAAVSENEHEQYSDAETPAVSDKESIHSRSERDIDDKKRRILDDHPPKKKLKKSKSDSKLRTQTSHVFKKVGTPETLERTKSNDQPSSPQSNTEKIIKPKSTATTASPSPVPLTKAQEEQKAKNAEEARIWQEKVEAKKRARRDMFLKSEKEKERKKKEEEERRVEEEKRLAEFKEKEKVRLAKEAQEQSKIIEQQKEQLMHKQMFDMYPIGLKTAKFGVQLSDEYILQYTPLYVFDIEGTKYVTDLQVSLITGRPVADFNTSSTKPLSSGEKSKLWDLFFHMVGIDRNRSFFNLNALRSKGHSQFQNLLVSFVELDHVSQFVKNEHPGTYRLIWGDGSSRLTEVDLKSMSLFEGEKNHCFVSEGDMEVVIDTKSIAETSFVPPRLRRRRDTLRAISTVARPMCVSRASLYNSDDEQSAPESPDQEVYVAPAFDFIEVDNTEDHENDEEEEEFDFPLFASAATSEPGSKDERGRPEQRVMKVSIREESVEKVNNERPQTFYYANYTAEQKHQFELAAVTAEDIYKNVFVVENASRKCIDLKKHNDGVEAEKARVKAKKRPGMKYRLNKIGCRERKHARAKLAKKLEREQFDKRNQYKRYSKPAFRSKHRYSTVKSKPSTE